MVIKEKIHSNRVIGVVGANITEHLLQLVVWVVALGLGSYSLLKLIHSV